VTKLIINLLTGKEQIFTNIRRIQEYTEDVIKTDRIKLILNSVPSEPLWDSDISRYCPVRKLEDFDDPYLHPFKISEDDRIRIFRDGTAKQKSFERAIMDAASMGHFLKLSESLIVILCILKEQFLCNPIIMRLKSYVDHMPGDVALPSKTGGYEINWNDTMSANRVLLSIQVSYFYEEARRKGWSDLLPLIVELFEYLFKDPTHNTKFFKKHMNVILKNVCSLCTDGHRVEWNLVDMYARYVELNRWEVKKIDNHHNDRASYLRDLGVISEAKQWMNDEGLTELFIFSDNIMMNCPREVLPHVNLIQGVLASAGYSRTHITLSHMDAVLKEVSYGNNTAAAHFRDVWYHAVMDVVRNKRVPSFSTFKRQIVSSLTTKSAGGKPFPISITIKRRNLTIVLRDKTGIFLVKGKDCLDLEKLVRGYPIDDFGYLSYRFVPYARLTRAVFMRNIVQYIWEIPLGRMISECLMGKFDTMGKDDKAAPLVSLSIDCSAYNMTGIELMDFGKMYCATGCGNWYLSARDYGNYDIAQTYNTTRIHNLNGVLKALRESGLNEKWGPFENFSEYVKTIWSRANVAEAHFRSTTGPWGVIMRVDQVTSGEYMTFVINTLNNVALTKTLLEFGKNSWDLVTLDAAHFMGDDSLLFLKSTRHLGVKEIDDILKQDSDIMADNGHEINPAKTSFRRFRAEYLKKTSVYGMNLPLRHTQLFSSERPKNMGNPVEHLIGYNSTLSMSAYRGGDHDMLCELGFYTWLIHRKVSSIREKVKTWKFFPVGLYFTPISLNGVGAFPGTVVGASQDGAIVMESKYDQDLYHVINEAASAVTKGYKLSANEIADALIEEKWFEPGIDFSKQNLDGRMAEISYNLCEDFRSRGVPFPMRYAYMNQPSEFAKRSAKSIGETMSMKNMDREFLFSLLNDYRVQDLLQRKFSWLFSFDLEEVGEIGAKIDDVDPFITCDLRMRKLSKIVGIKGSRDLAFANPNSLLNYLKQSPTFPRNVQPDDLVRIFSHPWFITNPDDIPKCLMAMGAESQIASEVSKRMTTLMGNITMLSTAQVFSWNDTFLPNLDLGQVNIRRFVRCPELGVASLGNILSSLTFYYSILKACVDGKMRILEIVPKIGGVKSMMEDLFKGTGRDYIHSYVDLYHKSPWLQ
jgi:hypothetical protein